MTGPRSALWRGLGVGAICLALAACALPPEMEGGASLPQDDVLPPPGFGTLRQDEVSIALTSGDLRLLVTPLEDEVILMTAPDTYRRLAGIAGANRTKAGGAQAKLFLVSFFSDQPDVRFVPEEVQLVARGLRHRPAAIVPVTPSWGERRLSQRRTEMAVYGFSEDVDLETPFTLAYGLEQSSIWATILPRIHTERARARGRAGVGSRAGVGDFAGVGARGRR